MNTVTHEIHFAAQPLSLALAYRHEPLVRRLQEKEGLSETDARSAFADMLRFLFLCGTREDRFAPSERIDLAWHHFILFTRDYAAFCQRYFGHFLHHQPHVGTEDADPDLVPRTLRAAREAFGSLGPNWSYRAGSTAECGFSDCAKCSGSTNCQS